MDKLESNLAQLRNEFEKDLQIHDRFLNDFDLRRGLQGHDNDIDYVRKHLRAHLRFLSCMNWEKFERHPVVAKYYPFGFVGDTGKGNDTFLYIETVGRSDPVGLLNCAPMTEIILNRLYYTESMIRQLREYENRTGKQAKLIFVFDLEEFTLDSSWLSILGRQFKIGSKFFSDRYSEILCKLLVVNCPSYIYYLWRMMQPILPEMTRRKVELLYGDDWKEKLLQYVSADRLPAHWGGTLKDENDDPMYRSKVVVPPGKIPKNLLWHASSDDPSPQKCRHLAISAGQYEYVDVKVTKAQLERQGGLHLKWYFTTSGDFSFGVFFRSDEDKSDNQDDLMSMEMVFPFFEHLPATQIPEMAKIECKKAGTYKLRFGNEMGWWSKLNVMFDVQCV